jgi:anti-sigma factor RsiW
MTEFEQHDCLWSDRLQDLLDDELLTQDRAVTESHLAICGRCRAQYAYLKRIDAALNANIDSPSLDHTFDRQLFARIESNDAQAREKARRRLERELAENLEQLSRSWKRTLAFIVSGALAGIALAVSCVAWANAAGFAHRFADAAAETAGLQTASIHIVITIAMVGGIGAIVARWLATHGD